MSAPRGPTARKDHIWALRSGIAACLIDGMTAAESAAALGCCVCTVDSQVALLKAEYGQPSKIKLALALALEREGRVSTDVR